MRIAHFLGTMRPGTDGTVRFIYKLREAFENTGDEHLFVSPMLPKKRGADQLWIPSIPSVIYPDYRVPLVSEKSLQWLFQRRKPDLMHLHTPCPLGNAALKLGLTLEIPVMATFHSNFPAYLPYYHVTFLNEPLWNYLTNFYNRCSVTVIESEATRRELEARGIRRLVKIYPGVDASQFSPKRRSDEFRKEHRVENKFLLTYVGRLVWEKNLQLIVRAWGRLRDKSRLKLLMVGDGPKRKAIQRALPEAIFTGFLAEEELYKAFASSDVFLFPSMMETFGSVTIEALASGVPTIVARGSAACDFVIHGKNGLHVDPVNPDSMAEAIERLYRNADERRRMAEEALTSSRIFRWDETIEQYLLLYRELVPRLTCV